MLKNFRTYNLSVEFYRLASYAKLPYHLKEQLLRASSSIALNLAEGSGKRTVKDKVRFYQISFGSLRECQAILTLADLTNTQAWNILNQLGGALYRLIQNAK